MFSQALPEQIGVSSENLLRWIDRMERESVLMHSAILARGNRVFFKAFWSPFKEHSIHRMYSQTKSFVGIAVCELAAEGKLDIHRPIVEYFPDVLPAVVDERLKKQTVEDMLTMRTCMQGNYWFDESVNDRLRYYFACQPKKEPHKDFFYDSDGSFVLGCLVERVTGKDLLSYLREHFLDAIGFSENAHMLKVPGGYSWGDSSMLCETEDMLAFGRLLANGGQWDGKQVLHADWVKAATADYVSTSNREDEFSRHGYGYQIWRNRRGGFSFLGMHGQYMHYDPETDIIFVSTAGNRFGPAGQKMYDGLVEDILADCRDTTLPANPTAVEKLNRRVAGLHLSVPKGEAVSSVEKTLSGCRFSMQKNPMGWRWISFTFLPEEIRWEYENDQGVKELIFGRCRNVLSLFPQEGYSDQVGNTPSPGHRYRCAAGAAWETDTKLVGLVQIIDEYIGVLDVSFAFDGNTVTVQAVKNAEDFLQEYEGTAVGTVVDC